MKAALLYALLLLTACGKEGPKGADGPAGIAGPAGADGAKGEDGKGASLASVLSCSTTLRVGALSNQFWEGVRVSFQRAIFKEGGMMVTGFLAGKGNLNESVTAFYMPSQVGAQNTLTIAAGDGNFLKIVSFIDGKGIVVSSEGTDNAGFISEAPVCTLTES